MAQTVREPSARDALLKIPVNEVDMWMMGVLEVSSDEGWGVDRTNGRSYILGSVVNQDPGGNIDKDQIRG